MGTQSLVEIDDLALGKECISLPSLILQASTRKAELSREMAEMESQLDILFADLGRQMRDMPNKFGMEKATVDAVKGAIELNPKYQEKLKQIRDLRHQVDLMSALLAALGVKKTSLTLLVELHGMGYFAEVKASGEARAKVKEQDRRSIYQRQHKKLSREKVEDDD